MIGVGTVLVLGWLLLLIYGIVKAVAWRGNPDRAARFRAVWLGIVSVLLLLGAATSMAIDSLGSAEKSPSFVAGLIAFMVAHNATKLWNRGLSKIPGPPTASS